MGFEYDKLWWCDVMLFVWQPAAVFFVWFFTQQMTGVVAPAKISLLGNWVENCVSLFITNMYLRVSSRIGDKIVRRAPNRPRGRIICRKKAARGSPEIPQSCEEWPKTYETHLLRHTACSDTYQNWTHPTGTVLNIRTTHHRLYCRYSIWGCGNTLKSKYSTTYCRTILPILPQVRFKITVTNSTEQILYVR